MMISTIIIDFFILFSALGLDNLTKTIVSSNMELNSSITIIDGFFKIQYVRNSGAAFSILENQHLLFYIITPIAISVMSYLYFKEKSRVLKLCFVFMIAGALGNFIDRILYKEVVDFISFTFFKYEFAIFNVADIYLTCSVTIYAIFSILREKNAKHI